MKIITCVILFNIYLISPHLFAVTRSYSTIDSIEIDIQRLSSNVRDSLGLEELLGKIIQYHNDPITSLRYIRAYEKIVALMPNIPNRIKRVYFLKGNRYNSLAWSNNRSNIPLAKLYIDSALVWHERAHSEKGYWLDQYGLGVLYRNTGDNEKALDYLNAYYKHYQDPYDSIFIANVQFQRATVFLQIGKLEEASIAILEAIALEEKLGRKYSLATNLNALAIIKKHSKLFDEVMPIYDKVHEIWSELKNTEGQARVLYNKSGFLMEHDQDYEALTLLRQAKSIAQNPNLLSYIYEGLGTYFLKIENIDSATYYLNSSYSLRKNSGNDRDIYIVRHKLGKVYANKGDLKAAEKEYQFALQIAETQGEKDKINQIVLDYAKILERQGRYKQANIYLNQHIAIKDSLVNKTISKSVEELTVKYEAKKKENEIIRLTNQNQLSALELSSSKKWNVSLLVGMIFIGILAAFIFRQSKKIKSQNQFIRQALSDKDTLLKEIHHRVKNNLQVISALLTLQSSHLKDAQAKEALKEGQDRVQSMALIHKDLYQHDNLKGVNTKDYLEQLIDNLFQSYRIDEDHIRLKTDIQPLQLDVDTMIPMGLMINELISNALKHAYIRKKESNIEPTP